MKLTVGFQLPFKLEDIYLDWEKQDEKPAQKIQTKFLWPP